VRGRRRFERAAGFARGDEIMVGILKAGGGIGAIIALILLLITLVKQLIALVSFLLIVLKVAVVVAFIAVFAVIILGMLRARGRRRRAEEL
jgi:hypothetical protein